MADGKRDDRRVDREPDARDEDRPAAAPFCGMKVFSSSLSPPNAFMTMAVMAWNDVDEAEEVAQSCAAAPAAACTTISGSRPTMIVSVWWRAWLQRQVTGLRMIMKRRDLVDDVVHPARPEGGAVAAFVPARIRRRAVEDAIGEEEGHRPPALGQSQTAMPAKTSMEPSQIAVSRIAGPSERFISSFMRLARNVGVVPLGRRQAPSRPRAEHRARRGCSRGSLLP